MRARTGGEALSALLSASGLYRARKCPAAYALPAVQTTNEAQQTGVSGHKFLEKIARGIGRPEALEGVSPEDRKLFESIDLSKIPQGQPEVSFRFDTVTGEADIVNAPNRSYDDNPRYVFGTCDLVCADRVIDWKFTVYNNDFLLYKEQLEFYGMCLSRARGLDLVTCSLSYIADNGAVSFNNWVLDWELVNRVAERTKATAKKVVKQVHRYLNECQILDVSEGIHCHYCPAWWHCPAKMQAVRWVLGNPNGNEAVSLADSFVKSRDAVTAHDRIKALTKEVLAEHKELRTSDGRVLKLDGRGAVKVKE